MVPDSAKLRREWPYVLFVLALAGLILVFVLYADRLGKIGHVLGPSVSLISVLLVVFGWRVAYSNSVRVAMRSEAHTLVNLLIEKVEKIEDRGSEFWAQPAPKRGESVGVLAARRMLASLESVRALVELLGRRNISLDGFDFDFSELRQALTLDVEDAGDVSDNRAAVKIHRISLAAQRIRRSAYDRYLRSFPPIPVA